MSACTRCRWGPGTTCDKTPDTEASQELKARLAAIQTERAKLDAIWTTSEPAAAAPAEQTQLAVKKDESTASMKVNSAIKTSKEIHTLAELKAERERQDSLWR